MNKFLMALMMFAPGLAQAGEDAFGGADWICPAGFERAKNATIEVRCPFEAKAEGSAELAVSADAVYAVRLNGRTLVASARLPDVPPARFYDVWKVEGIRAGANELSFSVYSPGVGFSRFLIGHPGLRFRLSGDGCRASSSDALAWRPSTADRRENVDTCQLGFSFEHDATQAPAAWRAVTADDRRAPPRDATWEKRPFPAPPVLPFVPAKRIAEGVLDGSPADSDVARGMDAAKLTPRAAGGELRADDYTRGLSFLYDLGREEAGHLEIELDANAGAIVDIGHAEHAEDGRITALVGTRHFAGRYLARDGRQTFLRWQYRMAGRYIQIHVRGAKPGFAIRRVGLRPVLRTDATERPVPPGLDARQTAIWKTSVRTLQLCMHEHYEDCPWREQSLYANDSRNQILCGRFAFENDSAYALHSLDLLGRGLGEDGWIELCMPARQNITIPSFTFSWNLALADCLRLYGPSPALEKLLPTARKILDHHLGRLRDGLLPRVRNSRNWHFYDWVDGLDGDWDWAKSGPGDPSTEKPSFDAPLNLYFLLALEADADIAEKCGDAATAARWRAAAAKLRMRIRETFWNETAHRFDTYAGRPVKFNAHELTQALAILADAVPDGWLMPLAEQLVTPSGLVETSLSQSLHKFEALAKVSPAYGRRARRMMEATWGAMLDAGATSFWETKDGWKAFGKAGSLCHGWSAVPVYFYSMHPDLLSDEDWQAIAEREATDRPCRIPHVNPWWAGPGFWDRRHEAKLKEIAAGPKEYDFVFLGDSITHNWEGWSDPIDIDVVGKAYKKGILKFPNGPGRKVWNEMRRDYRLLNLGVGGDSTQHVLWRLAHGEMDGYRTKGVMLMIGANNTQGTPEGVARGVKAVLEAVREKQPQAKILLLPIFPAGPRADSPMRLRHAAVNRIIRSYADGETVIWCDFTDRFLERDGTLPAAMFPDALHPLENGYRIWRGAIEPYVRRILGREWKSQPLGSVRLGGEYARRQAITVTNNFLKIDRSEFLKPFIEKKNKLGYIALGKFIDTAVTLAKATGREDLKAIKEEIVKTALDHQQKDGYIGMLLPEKRMWEIWDTHEVAYIIFGLVSDWEEFGNRAALDGARKAADWVLANWHTKPATWGKTFVSEPMYAIGQCRAMMRLYKATGDRRYLDFVLNERDLANHDIPIVRGRRPMMWSHMYTYFEDSLALQMLWGLRPDEKLLRQSRRGFDFMLNRNGAVVTGGSGIAEGWTDSQDGDGDVGETCATVYQLFAADSLIRMGEGDAARLGDYMERTVWNALFGAQSPEGRKIRYYTALLGQRKYFDKDVFCCPNNYRRLIARLADFTLYTRPGGLFANLYTPLETVCDLDGVAVGVKETTDYPSRETVAFELSPARPAAFAFTLRIPKWCAAPSVTVNGAPAAERPVPGALLTLAREWKAGDRVELKLPMAIRTVEGRARQAGRVCFVRGPLVYAFNPAITCPKLTAKQTEGADLAKAHPFDLQKMMQVDPTSVRLVDDSTVRPGGTGLELQASFMWWSVGVDPEYAATIRLTEFADPDDTITYFRTPCIERDAGPDELFTSGAPGREF